MKYLNLGCGNHFSVSEEWKNIDFSSNNPNVKAHNLLSGIPFKENAFEFIYHSHVLEHFSKKDGQTFIKECHRVLQKEGVLRIVIPDLEQITKNYLHFLEKGMQNPKDENTQLNYEWSKIEMYDQTVRNFSGGEMAGYLFQKEIKNADFVFERIGQEGRELRKHHLNRKAKPSQKNNTISLFQKFKNLIKLLIWGKKNIKYREIGMFRLGGEIHQWMYDRYSLHLLLSEMGFKEIKIQNAFTSYLNEWSRFELDGKDGVTRKPDSLFIEAKKM